MANEKQAEAVALAWEQYMREHPVSWEFEWPPKPATPLSPEEKARRDAEWAQWDAEQAAKQAQKDQKFLGTVVAVRHDWGNDVLVYADGRELSLISEWYEWDNEKEDHS